jgi:hypothetical protein
VFFITIHNAFTFAVPQQLFIWTFFFTITDNLTSKKYRLFRLNHPVYHSVQLWAFEGLIEGRNLLRAPIWQQGFGRKGVSLICHPVPWFSCTLNLIIRMVWEWWGKDVQRGGEAGKCTEGRRDRKRHTYKEKTGRRKERRCRTLQMKGQWFASIPRV